MRPQTNLAFGGQQHFLKKYSARADLRKNVGTFLAFLCSSNWNEWYVNKRRSKGPGVEFKLRDMGHVFHVNISKCSFPKHMSRPAFTRPRNNIYIPFKEHYIPAKIQGLLSIVQVYHLTLFFTMRHLSFIIKKSLLLEMRHWSFTMRHRSSDIHRSSLKLNFELVIGYQHGRHWMPTFHHEIMEFFKILGAALF